MHLIDVSQEISPKTQVFPTYPTPYFMLWTKREIYGFEAEIMMMALSRAGTELREGDIVLVRTGWDRHLGEERYITGYPGLAKDVAEFLSSKKIAVLGVDTPNPDHPDDTSFPVHNTLLPQEILIIENLTGLDGVPRQRLQFIGLPLKLKGLSGSPIRAVLIEP